MYTSADPCMFGSSFSGLPCAELQAWPSGPSLRPFSWRRCLPRELQPWSAVCASGDPMLAFVCALLPMPPCSPVITRLQCLLRALAVVPPRRVCLTGHQKVHFSTFDGKLEFQCIRNGNQNHQFCPGSPQNTFIIFFDIKKPDVFQFSHKSTIWKSESLKNENS